MSYDGADLIFPHLGIVIKELNNHITLFGSFDVAFYGIIIGIGMLIALFVIEYDAKRHKKNPELYSDFFIFAIIFGVLGARIYYILFQWEFYRGDLMKMINIREGGLAIYGGIIAGCITGIVFTRLKKIRFLELSDCCFLGVLVGQFIGRWGNFFNCEAFGRYTDCFLAMRIKQSLVNPSMITQELIDKAIIDNGISYIQVHPTFLYESVWNILVFVFLFKTAAKKEVGSGYVTSMYLMLYGIGRFMIEGLRTDSLMIPGTSLAVSQCLSAALAVSMAVLMLIRNHKKIAK